MFSVTFSTKINHNNREPHFTVLDGRRAYQINPNICLEVFKFESFQVFSVLFSTKFNHDNHEPHYTVLDGRRLIKSSIEQV